MSLAVGAESSSSNNEKSKMGLDDDNNKEDGHVDVPAGSEKPDLGKHPGAVDETEETDDENSTNNIQLGPQCTLKEQIERDKDDESLRKWKEQLLGSVDFDSIGETLEPEVKIVSLSILSGDRADIVLSVPEDGKPKGLWFTLKEGSHYNLKFTFKVSNNIVSGLKYINTVWKTGMKVDSSKEMLGTFSPQPGAYVHVMPEETTPSGLFARGTYSAKTKFLDDDNKCYLEINYTFDIRKDWVAP